MLANGGRAQPSIYDILEQIRSVSRTNRELGDRFERLIKAYLLLDPVYADQFSDVSKVYVAKYPS